jgi:hypothetical protein
MLLIGAGGLIAVLISVVLLASTGGGDVSNLITQTVARQTAIIAIIEDVPDNVAHPDLHKFNADALLFMKSDLQSLTADMNAYGVESVPKEVTAAEADAGTVDKLSRAALENRFDAAYADVLEQKMDSQQALLQELYAKANSRVKSNVDAAYQNLQALQESLEKIRL